MAALRAVVDTNVLVAAAIAPRGTCGRLLMAAIEGRWRLVLSPLLVAELDTVLAGEVSPPAQHRGGAGVRRRRAGAGRPIRPPRRCR